MAHELLIVATNKFILGIDPVDGREVWRTRIPSATGGVISLLIRGEDVFAGQAGRVCCLDRKTGTITWQNNLPGTGFHPVMMAMEGEERSTDPMMQAAIAAGVEQQQRAAAAASS